MNYQIRISIKCEIVFQFRSNIAHNNIRYYCIKFHEIRIFRLDVTEVQTNIYPYIQKISICYISRKFIRNYRILQIFLFIFDISLILALILFNWNILKTYLQLLTFTIFYILKYECLHIKVLTCMCFVSVCISFSFFGKEKNWVN